MEACHTVNELDPRNLDAAGWDRLVQRSPEQALVATQAALSDAGAAGGARAVVLNAAGRSLLELGRVADASAVMKDATALVVQDSVDDETRRSVLMTAAAVFAEAGEIDAALASLAILEQECTGTVLGRVRLQQAVVLHHAGRLHESLRALDQSDRLFARDGSDQERFRVHINRGVVLLQQGELDAAETDFLTAAELARRLGMTAAEGQCHANAGALYGRARRLVDALRAFDRAAELLESAGRPDRVTAWMEIDRAEVLMHFGLVDDAVAAAHRAFATAERSGNDVLVGDALMMCARTELRAGRTGLARRTSEAASKHLTRTGRPEMVGHADAIAAHAALRQAGADVIGAALERSRDLVERLRSLGWHREADELSVERIRAAWRTGAWADVDADVQALRLHAWGSRRDLALVGWFAEAVARRKEGLEGESVDAAIRGLEILDDITAEATNLEDRSAAMRLGHDLSRWITEVAIDQHEPDLVLAASEGTRARSLHDELGGRNRHRALTQDGADRLRSELRSRLHGRCLVQWVVTGGRVHAVVCGEEGNRLVDVADLRAVMRERDRVLVWLDRAAAEPDESDSRARRAASLLDEMLIAPLGLPDGASIVIVPVDELHGVAWSGLPSIAARPLVLNPSSRLWLDADRRSSSALRTVGFVSGPNIGSGEVERSTLARLHGQMDHAGGAGATAATVRTMFGAHDLVHVAAHGRFRADRPLLSTFELADGRVTLHDAVPERVHTRLAVMSSCEGGAHGRSGGSEVLGLAAVLLARGAASVLAPLTLVRDLECGEFVSAVHEQLAAGTSFAASVAQVRTAWLSEDDLSRWAVASSFSCFGSGATRFVAAPE